MLGEPAMHSTDEGYKRAYAPSGGARVSGSSAAAAQAGRPCVCLNRGDVAVLGAPGAQLTFPLDSVCAVGAQ
eukprot:11577096-Alexandrium_andersonii.AAC.1